MIKSPKKHHIAIDYKWTIKKKRRTNELKHPNRKSEEEEDVEDKKCLYEKIKSNTNHTKVRLLII